MENANKALIMGASTIIAVMLFALFVIFIKNISIWPEAQDEMLNTEQIENFNKEYEVYQKSAMYGVDVISCLNKAQSNNEKYVEGKAFLGDKGYGKTYEIDVFVRLDDGDALTKSCLSETVTIYYYNKSSGKKMTKYDSIEASKNFKMEDLFKGPFYDTGGYTKFKKTDNLTEGLTRKLYDSNKYIVEGGGTHSLVENGSNIDGYYSLKEGDNGEYQLKEILRYAGKNMKQTTQNTDSETLEKWSSAVWETALYDLKKKRFKCDYIRYSNRTGLIDQIWFSEIN